MKILKMTGIILCAFSITTYTYADLPGNPEFLGPYLCIHQDFDEQGIPAPGAILYGVVISEFDECPTYNKMSSSNSPLTTAEINGVTWQNEEPNSLDPITNFVNSLVLTEDSHTKLRDKHPTDPSCRFGILF